MAEFLNNIDDKYIAEKYMPVYYYNNNEKCPPDATIYVDRFTQDSFYYISYYISWNKNENIDISATICYSISDYSVKFVQYYNGSKIIREIKFFNNHIPIYISNKHNFYREKVVKYNCLVYLSEYCSKDNIWIPREEIKNINTLPSNILNNIKSNKSYRKII